MAEGVIDQDEFVAIANQAQMPLLVEEVAKRVLDYVPVSDLKNCRRVCKTWWKESLVRFRRTHWLNLSTYANNAGRLGNDISLRDHEDEVKIITKCLYFKVFVSYLQNPNDPYQFKTHPFENLKFFKTKFGFSNSYSKLEWFRTTYGHFVKSLHIEQCTIITEEDFNKIIFRLSRKLEYLCLSDNLYKAKRPRKKKITSNLNVKELQLNKTEIQNKLTYLKLGMVPIDATPDDNLPLSWPQFLAHFPNIQNLELVKIDQADTTRPKRYEIEHILVTIHALQTQLGILQHLSGLDLLNIYDYAEEIFCKLIFSLMENLLPLTFFAYDIGYKNEFDDNSIYPELMGCSANTLETLVIYKAPFSAPCGIFPFGNRLPHLQKLALVGPIVKDLRFVERMPTLKILHLFHDITDEYAVAPIIPVSKVLHQLRTFRKHDHPMLLEISEVERVERVTVVGNTDFTLMSHLTLPNMEELIIGRERCTADKVGQLARLMPNVKRLRIGLSNSGFRTVCQNWKGLKELDISPVKVNDQGITGIVPGETGRRPNLTNLKYLRALGFGDEHPHHRFSELTDSSVEDGLMQLQYLERVSVMCSPSKMSEENYKKLNARFSSSSVRRFITEEIVPEENDCLENRNGNSVQNCDDW